MYWKNEVLAPLSEGNQFLSEGIPSKQVRHLLYLLHDNAVMHVVIHLTAWKEKDGFPGEIAAMKVLCIISCSLQHLHLKVMS